ncbi:MAG: signal peptidase I [Saprospiraceae bacterium]
MVFAKAESNLPEGMSLKAADAWIPGVNFMKWAELVGRNGTFAFWLLVPLVNVFIFAGLCVDLARSFNQFSFWDSFMSVVIAPIYFILLGKKEEAKYEGPILIREKEYAQSIATAYTRSEKRKAERLIEESPYKRSGGREWAEAIIFAVSAAALIRLFVFEMFTIPTSSMEGSMLVGDYLLVSKAHYGVRTPKTIAMIPLLHNRLPFDMGESYLESPSLEMTRFPALENIDRNDPIVFNYPLGDSVYVLPGRSWSAEDYRFGNVWPQHANQIARGNVELITRPLDKKDHYVKRAVAVAGDEIEIRDRDLYINGERSVDAPNIQFRYQVTNTNNALISFDKLYDWGISTEDLRAGDANMAAQVLSQKTFGVVMNQGQIDKLKGIDPGIIVEPIIDIAPSKDTARRRLDPQRQAQLAQFDEQNKFKLFPHDPKNFPEWTKDNFGPLKIPQAGETIAIGPNNIALYTRIISVYEGHELKVKGGAVYIDGEQAKAYTFKQDYYWAMGDNRHSSEDSRFWGFVPADHIVGKPMFIWFSTKDASIANGIRWNRIFKNATQMD